MATKEKTHNIKHWLTRLGIGSGIAVGLYGIVLAAAFFALKWHWTDIPGTIDPQSRQFQALAKNGSNAVLTSSLHLPVTLDRGVEERARAERVAVCKVKALAPTYPANAARISEAHRRGADIGVITRMLFAVGLRLDEKSGLRGAWQRCDESGTGAIVAATLNDLAVPAAASNAANVFPWAATEEWGIIAKAFAKENEAVQRAAKNAGADPRMIVATGSVEQFRLYFTQRELFEKFFKPLVILSTTTDQAMGVMAMKDSFAKDIERHLGETRSPYYLGSARQHLLDFSTENADEERKTRLTNEKDHYYSYLYGGLALAQIVAQWDRAGFPIAQRPEILATLFNIGFSHSKPNANPQVGGSEITINNVKYSFGGLAFELYYSGELQAEFPYPASPPQART